MMRVRKAPGVKTSLTGLELIPSKRFKDRTRFQEKKRAAPGSSVEFSRIFNITGHLRVNHHKLLQFYL